MPANRYMVDSGGTTRHIKKRFVVDSGGVTRLIKKRYIVDAGGTTRLTFLYGNNFTMLAGQATFIGYNALGPTNFGSITPSSTLNDGAVIGTINTNILGPGANLLLYIFGFASNPGASYVTTFTINGVTVAGTAAVYQYGGVRGVQTAQWTWNAVITGFTNGGTYPATLITV